MDKFGIFNLINSLFSLNNSNDKKEENVQNNTKESSSNENLNSSNSILDLFKGLSTPNPKENTQNQTSETNKQKTQLHMEALLKQMQMHEDFVKRVKTNEQINQK